ncbi:MAG: kinase [Desulfobacteraceae bacterium]|nr:kinase [Desulfobacteraceae bacterium]
MIISRTPFRISFFGGGTDYPVWYKENGGAVLATTINKYCYITCRYLPPFFKHKSRIVYSLVESVKDISEIKHPSVRACLGFMKVNRGVEIHHDGDLPARSGIGSSSSFTVGLLHALYALKGRMPTKRQLVLDAIRLEQEVMKENVGSQDQSLAAFGGFNLIDFGGPNHIQIRPVTLPPKRLELLQNHLMLFFTGFSRTASEIAGEQIKKTGHKKKELKMMHQMVNRALEILNSKTDLAKFGRLLHENWQIKRSLSRKISIPLVDEIYSAALGAGALGGKILGAGGGGFMLIFAKPEVQPKIRRKLKNLLYVPFKFESLGSQIIFYSPYDSLGNIQ